MYQSWVLALQGWWLRPSEFRSIPRKSPKAIDVASGIFFDYLSTSSVVIGRSIVHRGVAIVRRDNPTWTWEYGWLSSIIDAPEF